MKTNLTVEGMSCNSCVRHVDQALRKLQGVSDVEVNLEEGKALVTHEGVAVQTMQQALEDAGYESSLAG